ncbi:MAG: threonylcarbamoyl-AMP synthase [Rhodospirillales bacterium]|nr:threonylcarbamoyl-AMP synthase [Alphaproteobacteria bacterium]USO04357.1 MAG: threonylcarbamoyl-AMP synthase [Rhodospirillales bacterium]
MTQMKTAGEDAIQEAALLLRAGGLVAFPTETVYGLGANALDGRAVARIFEAKNRPSFNPLIVHVPDRIAAEKYVEMDDRARSVAKAFWPGPLTLILPRKQASAVSDLASAGLPTLAIRVPAHKVAQSLLRAAGIPVAAPSANASGEPSATTPRHVQESLGGRVPFILAGGACEVGLESTVLDLSGKAPVILRPGAVTAEDLAPLLGPVAYDFGSSGKPPSEIKSPGQLLKHYAPSLPVRLNAVDLAAGEALLAFGPIKFMGIRGGGAASDLPGTQYKNLSESGDLVEAASNLFTMLRDLDRPEHKAIAVMNIPDRGLGLAINDRLSRASSG